MNNLEKDLNCVDLVLSRESSAFFHFIYSRTNENIKEIFDNINLNNKDIYSVLSSSDYLFYSLCSNINSIDVFDVNPLTYRYFYLRKWLLENGLIDADNIKLIKIKNIINSKKTNVKDELDSIIFWKSFLKKINSYDIYGNLLFEYTNNKYEPYKNNINIIVNKLSKINLKFDNIDISDKNITNNKKYDYIFLSNILDYNRNKQDLINIKRNLINLLKDNGNVICVNMLDNEKLYYEKDYFNSDFIYNEISNDNNILYYKYTKR